MVQNYLKWSKLLMLIWEPKISERCFFWDTVYFGLEGEESPLLKPFRTKPSQKGASLNWRTLSCYLRVQVVNGDLDRRRLTRMKNDKTKQQCQLPSCHTDRSEASQLSKFFDRYKCLTEGKS